MDIDAIRLMLHDWACERLYLALSFLLKKQALASPLKFALSSLMIYVQNNHRMK
jgi:hypothetical protein